MEQKDKEILFSSFLDNYKKQIYRVCWGFTDNANDVNELFQETILRIWKGIDGFKGKSSPSTWIYRISVNTCIYWKKQKMNIQLFNPIDNDYALPTVPPIEEQIIQNENIAILRKAILQLSQADRTLILLYMEDCSYKDIAEITGLSLTNVGVKINRIKIRLKELIKQK